MARIWTEPKPKWSNLRGDYEGKEWCAEFHDGENRFCNYEQRWRTVADFDFHHKGRFAGFYHTNCRQCAPLARQKQMLHTVARKAEFDQNKANGLVVYNANNPPFQCSKCWQYSNPPLLSRSHPREFYQKDNGAWKAQCTWCEKNHDRTWELLMEEVNLHNGRAKACPQCRDIKLRANFTVMTPAGVQVRSCCDACRPRRTALWKQRRADNFDTKSKEKIEALESNGCASYTETKQPDCPCPFGFDKRDVDFDEFVAEVHGHMGRSLTTAFDFHHPGEKTDHASRIWDEYDRNLETHMVCEFSCKFCHTIHHALEDGPPTPKGRIAVVQCKLEEIRRFGCAGPGSGPNSIGEEDCPFGFQPTPALQIFLDDLVDKFGEYVVVKLFNNDHDDRTEERHGKPSTARNEKEYKKLTKGCTIRCKMCDAIKSHWCGDNVPLKYTEEY